MSVPIAEDKPPIFALPPTLINDSIRANHYHPAELDNDTYRQIEKDVIALGDKAGRVTRSWRALTLSGIKDRFRMWVSGGGRAGGGSLRAP